MTEWVLKEVYQQLYYANVPLEKTVLKPNMVIAGKKAPKQASRQEVAERTVEGLEALRAGRGSRASPSSRAGNPTRTPPPTSR